MYGLGYRVLLQLLPRDFPSELGTAFGAKKRWNKIWVRLRDSVIPIISSEQPPTRDPSTPMDTATELSSEDIQVTSLKYGQGDIIIYKDLPLPLNITGIFGELTMEKVG